ncbi:MAG: Zn-ribbon domain-containing OB-fold protein [Proteobacteria bacterium]|nr:Zn-ribbon domain-containing OB-fold protein [Pseudomonadota bacterium]
MSQPSEKKAPAVRKIFPPAVNEETAKFWKAAEDGKLLYGFCLACNEPHYYPRTFCPFCFSDKVEWREANGKGKVYSYSVMHRSPTGPYTIAYVELQEGPRILTNLVDCDFDKIAIDAPVSLVWKSSDGGAPVPFFTLG